MLSTGLLDFKDEHNAFCYGILDVNKTLIFHTVFFIKSPHELYLYSPKKSLICLKGFYNL